MSHYPLLAPYRAQVWRICSAGHEPVAWHATHGGEACWLCGAEGAARVSSLDTASPGHWYADLDDGTRV